MIEIQNNSAHLTKRKNSAILIFSIFTAQLISAAIIFNLVNITPYYLIWTLVYYILAFTFAIPQAGISDIFGRKRHLIIASISILIANILFIISLILLNIINNSYSSISSFFSSTLICFFLGITGNAIPIARAGIADLQIHEFRTAMGWSTIMIGLGWISAVLLGMIFSTIGLFIICSIFQSITVFFIYNYFFDSKDVNNELLIENKNVNNYCIQSVIFKSYKWFGSMFLVSGGAAAIIAYLFSEATFYQIFSLHEDGEKAIVTRIVGIFMALGYTFGVIIQWIIAFSDKEGIKRGIYLTIISLLILIFTNIFLENKTVFFFSNLLNSNMAYLEGSLGFIIAIGYGFIDPSLFSLMSKKLETHHFGKLFGAIDSTSTLGTCIAFFILFISSNLAIDLSTKYLISFIIFIFSCIFFPIFLKKFASYENK